MFTIERLQNHDLERLKAIRLASLKEAPGAFGTTLAEASALTNAKWQQQLETLATFVAVIEGQDVGMVRCTLDSEKPQTTALISMWVSPTVRNQGVGQALVKAVIEWARDNKCLSVVLNVSSHNTQAISFYEKEGFVATGITQGMRPPREDIEEREYEFCLLH